MYMDNSAKEFCNGTYRIDIGSEFRTLVINTSTANWNKLNFECIL